MQKFLVVAVFTMLALVTAMGVRNLTVGASAANTQPVLAAWGGGPTPTGNLAMVVAWGGGPTPTYKGTNGLN